ncbi:GGDEF domain-containing protein [Anaerosinus massiliensis]|uniref:GGDEF domain-containing protein n=1 Tax=Massilibacillus massiliensis TaxID=1806837 RepID=UPI0018FE3DBF|nr:GGDEF domain-containing protein [Massilibacillus massiliensis]
MLQKKLAIFFGSDLPLQERLYYAVSGIGMISALLGLLSSFIVGLSLAGILASAACFVMLVIILVYVLKTKNFKRASMLTSLAFNLLIFPINFIYSGGIDGGMPLYFIMGIFFTFLLIRGKKRRYLISLYLVLYTMLMTFSVYNPAIIVPFVSERARLIDMIFALVIVSVFTGVVISIVAYEYSMDHQKVERLNRRLNQFAIKDSLTNLFNRRYLMSQLEKQIERAKREKCCLALIIFDIDYFKNINDTYGHLIGDEVLKNFSNLLANEIRGNDIVGRYGGEEFFIILAESDCNGAFYIAERIRNKVYQSILSKQVKDPITVSGGIGTYHSPMSVEELIAVADKNLYKAKYAGRNKIISA